MIEFGLNCILVRLNKWRGREYFINNAIILACITDLGILLEFAINTYKASLYI